MRNTVHVPGSHVPGSFAAYCATAPKSRRAAYLARQAERRRVNEAEASKVVPGVIVEVTDHTDAGSYRLFVTHVSTARVGVLRAHGYEVDGRGRALNTDTRAVWLAVRVMYAVPTPRFRAVREALFGRVGRHRRPLLAGMRPAVVTVHSDLSGQHAKAREAWEVAIGRPIGSVEYPRTDDQYEMPEPGVDLNTLDDDDEPARDDN